MAHSSEHQQYRDNLAKRLKETPKGRRQRVALERAQSTNEYGAAFQAHATKQIERGIRTDLPSERKELYKSLEKKIGNTPLVEVKHALPNENRLFIKCEFDNSVGHSHYDRVYAKLFEEKERLGLIKPGDTVFETTSGTAGVSFAAVGRELGYQCHVAIPAGGEKAREKAIEDAGATLHLTPAEEYVNGFRKFIADFSKANPDYVFLNHSMGNVLGKGSDVNENAVATMRDVIDETSAQLRSEEIPHADVVLSALGNGTNTLGLAERLKETEPQVEVVAYEMLSSGVGFSEKYGTDAYKKLLDASGRYGADDFSRHAAPGMSYPGIFFPALQRAARLVNKIVLVADEKTGQEYEKLTGNEVPSSVVKTRFGTSALYGRSTEAGESVARKLAEETRGKVYVLIGYDTPARYDPKTST